MVASWEVVAGLRCLEAGGRQAEAAGRRRSRVLPLLGHRCVLAVGEAGGGVEMLSGHLRLPAAKTHSHLSCETQDQYLIHQGGGERLDPSPIITSYLLDCIDHARGGCCSLRKHGSYCCGYRRHERQIWTPSAVNRRLPLRLG